MYVQYRFLYFTYIDQAQIYSESLVFSPDTRHWLSVFDLDCFSGDTWFINAKPYIR
jgi:hypothetical protein